MFYYSFYKSWFEVWDSQKHSEIINDYICFKLKENFKEDEYVIRDMVKRLVSTKSTMASEDANTQFIYGDLLNIALVLNELTNKKMTLYAEHVRAMANRMLEMEISICCELVEKMLYMAAILVDVDINIIMKVG